MSTTASVRGTNVMIDTLTIMDTIAFSGDGMTVGEVGKIYNNLTRRQIQKIVDNLEAAGFVFCENRAHGRTGKKVYRLAEYAAIICSSIARNYTEKN